MGSTEEAYNTYLNNASSLAGVKNRTDSTNNIIIKQVVLYCQRKIPNNINIQYLFPFNTDYVQ